MLRKKGKLSLIQILAINDLYLGVDTDCFERKVLLKKFNLVEIF